VSASGARSLAIDTTGGTGKTFRVPTEPTTMYDLGEARTAVAAQPR
jgi:hypothetical protein